MAGWQSRFGLEDCVTSFTELGKIISDGRITSAFVAQTDVVKSSKNVISIQFLTKELERNPTRLSCKSGNSISWALES